MDKDTKQQFEKINKHLSRLATKEELKSLATKEDLKGLATKEELNSIKTFLYKEMPTKREMEERFTELPTKKDFNLLQMSVDAYAKQSKDYYQEVTVLVAKVSRMEVWIKEASPKLGIKYQV